MFKNCAFLGHLWLQFKFFCNFLKKSAKYIDPFGYFVAQTSITSFYFFSRKVEKLNISAIYKSIILICSVNLPLVSIFKFYQKEFNSNNQENLENNIQLKFYKEGQNQNLISYYLFFLKSYFGVYFQVPIW